MIDDLKHNKLLNIKKVRINSNFRLKQPVLTTLDKKLFGVDGASYLTIERKSYDILIKRKKNYDRTK